MEWLAVQFAPEYGPRLRVNALAPGFFHTDQNRSLLTGREPGGRTPRGDAILRRTPLTRYGEPHDLDSALFMSRRPGVRLRRWHRGSGRWRIPGVQRVRTTGTAKRLVPTIRPVLASCREPAMRSGGRPTFTVRWFGRDDPVRLEDHGFAWTVAESVPVPDAMKRGTPDRDEAVARFEGSVAALGRAGVKVVCYDFMPVFDGYRTEFAAPLPDGSNAMRFRQEDFGRVDFADRIHFVHARNVRTLGERDVALTAEVRVHGDVDLPAVIEALLAAGFEGPIRPDHGRAIWGEQAIPAYGPFDGALGLANLQGLVDGREASRAAS